jgi:peptide/nickel transport system substrate-binding protein
VLHSSAAEGGYNYGLYANAELDAVIDRARAADDPKLARELWGRAQQVVAAEQPLTFLFEADRLHAVRKRLAGFRPGPRGALVDLERWHWENPR